MSIDAKLDNKYFPATFYVSGHRFIFGTDTKLISYAEIGRQIDTADYNKFFKFLIETFFDGNKRYTNFGISSWDLSIAFQYFINCMAHCGTTQEITDAENKLTDILLMAGIIYQSEELDAEYYRISGIIPVIKVS